MQSLALAFAQTTAQGRLMGQELLQFVNAGFNPLKEISDKTGVSMANLKKQMEDGGISVKMVEDAFKSATSEGGRFFGMADKQSKTLAGLYSTLKDNINMALADLGKEIADAFNLKELIPQIGSAISNIISWFSSLNPNIKQAIIAFGGLAVAIPPLLIAIGAASSIISVMGTGLAALLSPIGLVVAAVGTLAYTIYSNWESIKKTLVDSGAWDVMVNIATTAFGFLGDIFTAFSKAFDGDFSGMFDSLKNIVKRGWNSILEVFSWALEKTMWLSNKLFGFLGFDTSKNYSIAVAELKKVTDFLKAEVPPATQYLKEFNDWLFVKKESAKSSFGGFNTSKPLLSSASDNGLSQKLFGNINKIKPIGFIEYDRNAAGEVVHNHKLTDAIKDWYKKAGINVDEGVTNLQERFKNIKITPVSDGLDELFGAEMAKVTRDIKAKFEKEKGLEKIKIGYFDFSFDEEMVNGNIIAFAENMKMNLTEVMNSIGNVISMGIGTISNLFANGLASIFNKKVKFDFKSILGQFLSAMGDMFIAMATPLITAWTLANIAGVGAFSGNLGAALGLLGAGVALKGGGMALSQSVSSNPNSYSNGTKNVGNNTNIAPSININLSGDFQVQGTQLVAVINNTNAVYG